MLNGAECAFQVWSSLEEQLLPITKEKEIILTESLMSLKKGNLSLDDHLKKFNSICDNLAAVKKPMDETGKVFQLARALGPKYKDFRVAVLAKAPYPSYNQFVLALQAHKQMLMNESEEKSNHMNHEQAFVSQRGRG
ncbi:hypothetical protein ACOSP7_020190 [Xanthoceras sorbifolium]